MKLSEIYKAFTNEEVEIDNKNIDAIILLQEHHEDKTCTQTGLILGVFKNLVMSLTERMKQDKSFANVMKESVEFYEYFQERDKFDETLDEIDKTITKLKELLSERPKKKTEEK